MDILTTASRKTANRLLKQFDEADSIELPALPSAAVAFTARGIYEKTRRSVLCIAPEPPLLAELHRDLRLLMPMNQPPLYFPAQHVVKEDRKSAHSASEDMASSGQRLKTLRQLTETGRPQLVTASIQALMQKVPSSVTLCKSTNDLAVNQKCDRDILAQQLLNAGYEFSEEVIKQGQASVRGGLIDVWPATSPWPVRIEVSADCIESLRHFDPSDQRSRGTLEAITIPPPSERTIPDKLRSESFLSYLPDNFIVLWQDKFSAEEHAETFMATDENAGSLTSFKTICKRISDRKEKLTLAFGLCDDMQDAFPLTTAQNILDIRPVALHADAFEETRQQAAESLTKLLGKDYSIVLSSSSEGSAKHFFNKQLIDHPKVQCHEGPLSQGFGSERYKFVVVSENDLLPAKGVSQLRYSPFDDRESAAGRTGFRPSEITDFEPEDLVVHVEHGISIYKGINEIRMAGELQEVITLEYADGMMLHVPVTQAHLLSRYVGLPHHKARLHKLGGKRWMREKKAAHDSIMDMAGSLLELQAHRAVQPGHAFSKDKPWQLDFESSFRYQETLDQTRAIGELKEDMEAPHPMDRLICGDAGYGKTEVAMRGAFKAVMDNKQVVVLVPTTVLAQQHFDTFSERMSIYPVKIAMLSRFCSSSERRNILEELNEGKVDIVIGTHALLQPGIKFKDLGLVIIDEEQRFGVEHKEKLKHMRKLVDVLTMTATPIPRTLYMSMTGAREMSLIQTPPNERLPVKTIVAKNNDSTIKTAITSEIHRGGQVFYLHNRILTIDRVLKRLKTLLPEAGIGVAHGRMPAHELSDVMHAFARGDLDVLLCTTIIESGLDIPGANTILIDRADRFGISDLYQLRGRVGRSTQKAFAYLLLPERGRIDSDARTRIGAVKTYSGLAAGFNLALRDMEIRGVGNILGAEQSGHITAIGFGLYCQLLKRTVDQLKGNKPKTAVNCRLKLDFITFTFADSDKAAAAIPFTYIEEEKIRLGIYRKIAEASSEAEVKEMRAELKDRFGPLTPPVKRLLKVTLLRILASEKGITEIETREDKLMMLKRDDYIKNGRLFPRLRKADTDKRLHEIITAVKNV